VAVRRANIPQLLALNLAVSGGVYRALSAVDEARAAHEEILLLATAMHYAYFEEMAASELCADCAAVGDWEGAAAHARRALTLRDPNVIAFPAFSRWAETEALCRSGDAELAAKDAQRFGELSEGNRRYRVVYLCVIAVLAQSHGEGEKAKAYLQEAASLAEAIGLPGELRRLYAMLGETDHAAEIARSLAGKIKDEKLRAAFLAAETATVCLVGVGSGRSQAITITSAQASTSALIWESRLQPAGSVSPDPAQASTPES
jgi:tetratricopeptide (TPR) repeat protein